MGSSKFGESTTWSSSDTRRLDQANTVYRKPSAVSPVSPDGSSWTRGPRKQPQGMGESQTGSLGTRKLRPLKPKWHLGARQLRLKKHRIPSLVSAGFGASRARLHTAWTHLALPRNLNLRTAEFYGLAQGPKLPETSSHQKIETVHLYLSESNRPGSEEGKGRV